MEADHDFADLVDEMRETDLRFEGIDLSNSYGGGQRVPP
jgi:hypothetical protein